MIARLRLGIVFAFVTPFELNASAGQTNQAAQVFKPALDQIRGQTQIPILLPSKLPAAVREPDIKLAWGTATDSGYNISLYYTEIRNDVAFAGVATV